jgi:microcystin-dependent protein
MGVPYIGEIRMFAGNYEIAGWAYCNGQLMPISENDALFTLIGTTYGGDGQSTFALPDLRGRFPLHMGNGFTIGEAAGTEQETLTVNQLPNHTHALLGTTALAIEPSPAGNLVAEGTQVQMFVEDAADQTLAAGAVGIVGGSQPHENMHPYLTVNFIISLFGEFPSPT